jgi:DNA polymerase I
MMDAYVSGDPYLAFAKQAGAVPLEATKQSHKAERDQFKQCVLAVQYGMGADGLASRIGQPPILARELLQLHRETYRVFWRWSDQMLDYAMLMGSIHTVFGWRVQVPSKPNDRSLRNFPMQANGAEMLTQARLLSRRWVPVATAASLDVIGVRTRSGRSVGSARQCDAES